MSNARALQFLFGLVLASFIPIKGAYAQAETWVSQISGNDANACTRSSPCQTFQGAFGKTPAGGQVTVLDAGQYGPFTISKSITIINDTSGTALIECSSEAILHGAPTGSIVIAAGPNDVVTLRGLTINGAGPCPGSNVAGVAAYNAQQVNIEKCTILNMSGAGIFVTPTTFGGTLTLASSINVNIDETIVNGSAAGVRLTALPGVSVNASLSRSIFKNNNGGGIRIDGSIGGTITASIRDSESSLNNSNGIIALSGPGNVAANITRSVMASNVLSGVQSNSTNGGISTVTVNSSTISNNAGGAVNFFGAASLLTFGNNSIVAPNGTGFSGPAALQ